jgi:ADP-heptose:LPS heptosyltransferase
MSGSRAYGRILSALWLMQSALTPRRRPDRVKRILVLHRHLLGDTLMLTGLLAKLREQFADSEIIMAGSGNFGTLYSKHPYGVTYLQFDIRDAASMRLLRRHGPYDLAILPAENRWGWSARAFGARWVLGFAGEQPAKRNRPVDELRPYSQTPTAWTDTVCELIDGAAPTPYHRAQWPMPDCHAFNLPTQEYCVLHVGTSASLKLWPAERWRQLAAQLEAIGIAPVWSGGSGEEKLVHACDPDQRYANYAGKLDLLQAATLLRNARCLISLDTSIAHLGRIVGTPTIALFGQGSALLCGAGEFWKKTPYCAISIDVACRDQQRNFARIIPWVRRCERLAGDEPGQCSRAVCMEGIESDFVFQQTLVLLRQHSADTDT